MVKREFNDRIIRDGLPDGWLIQDRLDEKVALLIKETPGMWPGSSCVFLKPNAITTDEWLATAKQIAIGFDAAAPKWEPEIQPDVTAAGLGANAEAAPAETCERCQGNGEIVIDWERYRHPHPGDVGDEAVAECPECNGEGVIEVTPAPETNVAPIGWATVRVEDTCDGLLINADDMKRFGLREDVQYEGHFLPDGRYRIAIPSPAPSTDVVDQSETVDKARAWDAAQQSYRKGRLRALEEAAKIAETGDYNGQFQTAGDERRAKAIAERIRALATTEGSTDG